MTSSGLLDKAKAREDEVAVPVDDAELITAVEETTKDPIQTDVKTESAASDLKNPWFMIGIGMLAVSMVGLYFLKYIPGIAVLALFLVSFGIAGHGYTGGLKFDATTNKKWATLGVAWLILGAVPYIGGANLGGNISVSLDAANPLDESTNTLNFEYYSSGGLFGSGVGDNPLKITIEQDGTKVWTGEVPGDGDHGVFSLSIDEFYVSNALYVSDIQEVDHTELGKTDAPVTSELAYTLLAESSSGSTSNEVHITPALVTRTINDIDVEMSLYSECVSNCNDENAENDEEVDGVILKGWFGYMASEFDGALRPNAVQSDYTVATSIEVDGSLIFEYPAVTIDGTTATWDDANYGDGSGKVGESGSDFEYEGDAEGPSSGISYFTTDQIYDGDGCYTFTVTITNSAPFADGMTTVTEALYYQWDGGGTGDETLEEVSNC